MLDWQVALMLILGFFFLLLATGLPVAFCFMVLNVVGVLFFWGGLGGLHQFINSIDASLTTFVLLPVPLFILMGEVLFHSGVALSAMEVLDRWLGRLPGRLSLLAVGGGTLFATLTGTSVASVALLGDLLIPRMEEQGYKKSMSIGPILASGGIAILIPPSSLAVLLCAIAEISVSKVLIAIIVPGFLVAFLYTSYIIIRCKLQPEIAPLYEVQPSSLSEKLVATVVHILPIFFIIFLVIGLIFLGVATPSEGAATGAVGAFILCAFRKKLNWSLIKTSVGNTLEISIMALMIIAGSRVFSQILAYTGASAGLVEMLINIDLTPILIIIVMQLILLVLGTFMDVVSMMMVTLPIFMPIVESLGFNQIWFAAIMLINIEMAGKTPPFGILLFVMKGVAPDDTSMGDIIRAQLPFLFLDFIAMILIILFPALTLWLVGAMG